MRTVEELRGSLLKLIRAATERPVMYGGNDFGLETLFRHLLWELCFIDERGKALKKTTGVFLDGCRGVCGQFMEQERPFPRFINEVASVLAETAFDLGYFRPDRLLTEAEMSRLADEVKKPSFLARDWSESQLLAEFGPPSHQVLGGLTTVACYGCERTGVKWVHFDLARQVPWVDGWLPDPLLRDFRDSFHNEMQLLPIGRRWVDRSWLRTNCESESWF